jgi:gamma-glutamylcyclotransferase (GGCT)/AIG2-like uncharacterized protein YtfP
METNHQIFVYGSLRSGFEHPMFRYVSHYFHFVGHAKVKGLLYDLGEYPAAVPCKEEKYIIGEVYAIKNSDEFSYAIAQLDDYEGVHSEEGFSLYRRELTEVDLEDGKTEAWIYWYNSLVEGCPLVASGDVLQYLAEKKQAIRE